MIFNINQARKFGFFLFFYLFFLLHFTIQTKPYIVFYNQHGAENLKY